MVRQLAAGFFSVVLLGGVASAQSGPTLPSMPRPPSFDDPAPSAAKKPAKKSAKAAGAAAGSAGTTGGGSGSFERPNKFVPAEFDREGGAGGGSRMSPMMSSSGRPGMGMKF